MCFFWKEKKKRIFRKREKTRERREEKRNDWHFCEKKCVKESTYWKIKRDIEL